MIPAGETKHFPAHHVPGHLRPVETEPEQQAADDPIAEILSHKVGEVVEMLPALSGDELAAIDQAEQMAERPRKGVLEAIAAEMLRRAEAAQGQQPEEGEEDAAQDQPDDSGGHGEDAGPGSETEGAAGES